MQIQSETWSFKEHVIPIKHGGHTSEANLALACIKCNRNKGSDLATLDPLTGDVIRIFDPRKQAWSEHFEFAGAVIVGKTNFGRVTIILLQMNQSEQLIRRQMVLSLENR